MAVCSEIHTKHINTAVWAERRFCCVDKALSFCGGRGGGASVGNTNIFLSVLSDWIPFF